MRLALLNRWAGRIEGARVLDLFCGGGAVGLEALSRGAASVVFVDSRRQAAEVVQENVSRLGAPGVRIVVAAAGRHGFRPALSTLGEFDLVFADPPYDFSAWQPLLTEVATVVGVDGSVIVEHASRIELPPRSLAEQSPILSLVGRRRYGDSALSEYAWSREEKMGPPELSKTAPS